MLSEVFADAVCKPLYLGFNIAFPLVKFWFSLTEDVYLNEMFEPREKPQSLEQSGPRNLAHWLLIFGFLKLV